MNTSFWRIIRHVAVRAGAAAVIAALSPASSPAAELTADRLGMVRLLRQGAIGELERRLTEFQSNFESGRGSEWDADDHFEAFETSDPEIEWRLDEWMNQLPDSYAAPMARALYLKHRAAMMAQYLYPNEASGRTAQQVAQLQEAAVADLMRAIKRNPKLSIAYAAWMNIALDRGDGATVERVYAAGIAEIPNSSAIEAAYLTSINPCCSPALRHSRDALKAFLLRVKDLQRRFADNRDFDWMGGYDRYSMGILFLNDRRWDEAVKHIDEAIAVRESWYYYLDRARAHAGAEDHASALRDFERAAALNPTSAYAWDELGMYRRDRCFGEGDRFDTEREGCDLEGAVGDLSRALAIDPLNPRYLWHRLQVLNWLQRHDEAREDAVRALTFAQNHPWFHREYAQLLADSDREKAVAEYRLAVKLAADGEEFEKMFTGFVSFIAASRVCSALPLLLEYRDRCRAGPLCQEDANRLLSVFQMRSGRPCGSEQGPPSTKPLPMPDDAGPDYPDQR